MKAFTVLLLSSICYFVAAQETNTIFRSSYSLKVPVGLKVDTSATSQADCIVFFPRQSEKDKFSENINVIVEAQKGSDLSLDEYVSQSLSQLKQYFGNIILTENKRVKTATGQYHKMIYTTSMSGFLLRFEQRYYMGNDHFYVLTFTCEQSQYNAYKDKAGKILDSFKLK